jgi:hypothetical protein
VRGGWCCTSWTRGWRSGAGQPATIFHTYCHSLAETDTSL